MRKIEQLLKTNKITIYKLAEAIGESYPRTRYLVKSSNFSETYIILEKAAKLLDCKIDDLIDYPPTKKE
jgi:DNA-binding Xre family transcriptional regulator